MANVSALDAHTNQMSAATNDASEGLETEVEVEEGSEEVLVQKVDGGDSVATCQLYLRLIGRIDAQAEIERAEQRVVQLRKSIEVLEEARARTQYAEKVPASKQILDAQKVSFVTFYYLYKIRMIPLY